MARSCCSTASRAAAASDLTRVVLRLTLGHLLGGHRNLGGVAALAVVAGGFRFRQSRFDVLTRRNFLIEPRVELGLPFVRLLSGGQTFDGRALLRVTDGSVGLRQFLFECRTRRVRFAEAGGELRFAPLELRGGGGRFSRSVALRLFEGCRHVLQLLLEPFANGRGLRQQRLVLRLKTGQPRRSGVQLGQVTFACLLVRPLLVRESRLERLPYAVRSGEFGIEFRLTFCRTLVGSLSFRRRALAGAPQRQPRLRELLLELADERWWLVSRARRTATDGRRAVPSRPPSPTHAAAGRPEMPTSRRPASAPTVCRRPISRVSSTSNAAWRSAARCSTACRSAEARSSARSTASSVSASFCSSARRTVVACASSVSYRV